MPVSTCAKCGEQDQFEVVVKGSMPGAPGKIAFVQCARCGAVVGVLDYYGIEQRTKDLE
jgi:hypothetical protein